MHDDLIPGLVQQILLNQVHMGNGFHLGFQVAVILNVKFLPPEMPVAMASASSARAFGTVMRISVHSILVPSSKTALAASGRRCRLFFPFRPGGTSAGVPIQRQYIIFPAEMV